jgi:hypothetical protein
LKIAHELKSDKKGFQNPLAKIFKENRLLDNALERYCIDLEADPHALYPYFEIEGMLTSVWTQSIWESATVLLDNIVKEFPDHEDALPLLQKVKSKLAGLSILSLNSSRGLGSGSWSFAEEKGPPMYTVPLEDLHKTMHKHIGIITSTTQEGTIIMGTGILISPNLVLTGRVSFYDLYSKEPGKYIKFCPASSGK